MSFRRGVIRDPQFDQELTGFEEAWPRIHEIIGGLIELLAREPEVNGHYNQLTDAWVARLVIPPAFVYYKFTPRLLELLAIIPDRTNLN